MGSTAQHQNLRIGFLWVSDEAVLKALCLAAAAS
jgi:hypothetical protein